MDINLCGDEIISNLELYLEEILEEDDFFERLEKILKKCILANNCPGIDIIMNYYSNNGEVPCFISMLEIISKCNMDTMLHILRIWSGCDFNYEIFVEMTASNSDERVRNFVANLKQFVGKNGNVRIYSDSYVKEKILRLEEESQYFKNWRNLMETA